MTDQPPSEKLPPEAAADKVGMSKLPVAGSKSSPPTEANVSPAATGEAAPANNLTPEEQMALFEKELKEKDWGHQPC